MAPLTPHWPQPSHSSIQTVILPSNPEDFTTKSLSKISLPPFGLFAKLEFPPCTKADSPTYATVQMGEKEHLNLNSDLVYINHGCEPSLTFDLSRMGIFAGPGGLSPGDELTFFYPSTEWDMAQGFDCFCGAKTCRGFISGAKNMSEEQLSGLWLNPHIRSLREKHSSSTSGSSSSPLPLVASGDGNASNEKEGAARRGVTNREMSGEMGGDTK
ncbi:uncharacterized protein L3040_006902 [Drepanopeziza brunnea f. sp. 'multigermtubi']|uniref:Post-SET domain-containing protein n=1 Tax=Marssonina brunnea f. sp. multigermtubi (strain MB_m1) TaxID=1072389 RepID=K1WKJ0_MARBU|nr:uncharacterized protein MBM_08981 [Drepanopeziza brunnea f. sp. 'multigermtubi' MB_m1]EKD12752.1 hypothetical protein MBM_08981 [Drepanopeziza brunnea f. sp. 'multigermtubi' MB_m1]KAJ5038030.1 hypothetical protein L3040_006902 [Drepanopeziza brunnea f. sp. 'multigermtubi']